MVLLKRTAEGSAQYELHGTGAWKEVRLPGRESRGSATPPAAATQLRVPYTEMLQKARQPSAAPSPEVTQKLGSEGSWKQSPAVKENLRNMVLQCSFDTADRNKDGYLSKAEFGLFLRRALPDAVAKTINQAWASADANSDNAVSFQEFTKWIKCEEQKAIVDALNDSVGTHGNAMAALFRVWDADESGKISQDELRAVVKAISPKLSDDELDIIFQVMDSDGDGNVDYSEFIRFIGLSG
eukprot:TRINITY_DN4902_c0_g2_i1.p1 TRINITY_DN4902_c0_g2~~TRINITY_DN4902_c0_g2_i1.p1  ORF type:complete len:240 (-),score=51.41 TRINITY_DN4902_c0_g2_i1:42-761(-)